MNNRFFRKDALNMTCFVLIIIFTIIYVFCANFDQIDIELLELCISGKNMFLR